MTQKQFFQTLSRIKKHKSILITEGIYLSETLAKRNNLEEQIEIAPVFKVVGEGVVLDFEKLKKISDKVSIIEIDLTGEAAKVKTAKGYFTLEKAGVEDFPVINETFESVGNINFGDKFKKACKFVYKSDFYADFQGVWFTGTMIVATDRYIMYFEPHKQEIVENVMVHGRYNFLEGAFEIQKGGYYQKLIGNEFTLTYRNNATQMFTYDSVIPKTFAGEVTLTKKELVEKVELALLCANETKSFMVNFDKDIISSISYKEEKYESKLKTISVSGEEIHQSYNAKLLLSILGELEEDPILLKHQGSETKAIMINDKFLLFPVQRG